MNTLFHPVLAIFGFGAQELILILIILLVLFGGSKLPSLARGLGESIKEFKKASREDPVEDKKTSDEKKEDPASKTDNSKK